MPRKPTRPEHATHPATPDSASGRGDRSRTGEDPRRVWQFPDVHVEIDGVRHFARLTAAANGSWRKRHGGRAYHFGSWKTGAQEEALERWRQQWPLIVKGIPLSMGGLPGTAEAGSMRWSELCMVFSRAKREDYDLGRIRKVRLKTILSRTKAMLKLAESTWRADADVAALQPMDFRSLEAAVVRRYATPSSRASYIRHTREMLKFAWESGLLERPARIGGYLRGPRKQEVRAWNQAEEAKRGRKRMDRVEIRERLSVASRWTRPIILLGINAGFGANDCAQLKTADIGEGGLIDYARLKTGTIRIVQLWPETLEAIDAVSGPGGLALGTRSGQPWDSGKVAKVWRGLVDVVNAQRVERELEPLRTAPTHYWLRHTMLSVLPDEHYHGGRYMAGQQVDDDLKETYVHDHERMVAKVTAASAWLRAWLYADDGACDQGPGHQ